MEVKLKEVRLAPFSRLFTAAEFKPGDGKFRYDAHFLFEPNSANHKAVNDAIEAAGKETVGAKWEAFKKTCVGQSNKHCLTEGDAKGFGGLMLLSTHRQKVKGPPTVVDRNRAPLTEDSNKIFAGCFVNAIVDIYVQPPGSENPGIRASFSGIQFVKDGDPLEGGRPASPDAFDDLGEGAAADLI